MFPFSQPNPRRRGILTNVEVPFDRYLSNAFEQGLHDSVFGSVERMTEDYIYGEGPKLEPAQLQKQYPLLEWSEPEYEAVAKLKHERKLAENQRAYFMDNVKFLSPKWFAGFGTTTLASMLNPLDFALNFVPIVGSEARAASLGRGTIRGALARGLVSQEMIDATGIPLKKTVGALVEGMGSQAVMEIPLAYQNLQDQANYSPADSIANIAFGGAFSAGIHLGVAAASKVFDRLSASTKNAMFAKAVADFLEGRTPEVHDLARVDDRVLKQDINDARYREAGSEAIKAETPAQQEAAAVKIADQPFGEANPNDLIQIAKDQIELYNARGESENPNKAILSKILQNIDNGEMTIGNFKNLASLLNLEFNPVAKKFPEIYYRGQPTEAMKNLAGVNDRLNEQRKYVTNAQKREMARQMELENQALELKKSRTVDVVNSEKDRRSRELANKIEDVKEGKTLQKEEIKSRSPDPRDNFTAAEAAITEDLNQLKKDLEVKDEDIDLNDEMGSAADAWMEAQEKTMKVEEEKKKTKKAVDAATDCILNNIGNV